MVCMKMICFNFLKGIIPDNRGQGSVELILIIGGIIVIVLLVVSMYKSYLVDLGSEIDSNELNGLNGSFGDIASRFE